MRYDIEADWILLNTCNFRCGYCFVPTDMLGEKIKVYGTPEQWGAALDATGRTWLLHLTGGEPSVYRDFVALSERLTRRHFISLNSNLSQPSLSAFANTIDPSRVSFINAGLHLEERNHRSGATAFLRYAALLIDRGFPLMISLVATPHALERFDDAVDLLRPLGLVPIPKLFRGVIDGKVYPDSYSEADRLRFAEHARRARDLYQPILAGMAERPTLDIFRDDDFLDGEPGFGGQSCDAGSRFVRIEPNGDVMRCGPPRLGNLLNGSFTPMSGAAICDTKFCYYFCEKYTTSARQTQHPSAPIPSASVFGRMAAWLGAR